MTSLALSNLTIEYPTEHQNISVITDTSLTFVEPSFNLLIGPSGSGKSTFLKALAGLYPEYGGNVTGTILLDDQPITTYSIQQRTKKIGMLFQNPSEQFAMTTPLHEIIFTLENLSLTASEIDERAQYALAFVGISHLAHRQLNTLSGGEAQKVALAVVLAMQSDIILLDEPFASVDPLARLDLLTKLKELVKRGHTIIISDHDLAGYQNLAPNLFAIEAHQVKKITPAPALFKPFNTLQANFTLPPANAEIVLNAPSLQITTGQTKLLATENFNLLKNKMTLLTGPNGVGKSTLFGALTKLHPYTGSIFYLDQNIKKIKTPQYARQVALIFQQAEMQFLKMTLKEELELSLKYANYPELWSETKLTEVLAFLNMAEMQDHIIYQLSGGQKKKLQILIMLIIGTPVLLLDEPLAGLDLASVDRIMSLIKQMTRKQNQTVLMISHQLTGIPDYFDYHLVFNHQSITYEEVL